MGRQGEDPEDPIETGGVLQNSPDQLSEEQAAEEPSEPSDHRKDPAEKLTDWGDPDLDKSAHESRGQLRNLPSDPPIETQPMPETRKPWEG